MTDDPWKKKIYRAKHSAYGKLKAAGYRVIFLPADPLFDIEASRSSELRKVRVMLTTPTHHEISALRNIKFPPSCKKEIWVRVATAREFAIVDIDA